MKWRNLFRESSADDIQIALIDQAAFRSFATQLQNWLLFACFIAGIGVLGSKELEWSRMGGVVAFAGVIWGSRLMVARNVRAGAMFLAAGMWVLNSVYILLFSGVHSVNVIIYPFVASMCGWILGRRWLIGMIGLSVVWVLLLAFAERTGIYVPAARADPLLVGMVVASVMLAVAFLTLSVFAAYRESRVMLQTEKAKLQETQRQLVRSLNFDQLTGLESSYALAQRVEALVDGGQPMALMLITLRRLSQINHNFGPSVGNEAIVGAARTIANSVPEDCEVFRMSGSRLAVVCPGTHSPDGLIVIGDRLNGVMTRALPISTPDIYMDLSIGVAQFPEQASDREALFGNSMMAVARAEQYEDAHVQIYSPDMRDEAERLHWLDKGLHKAIEGNQFRMNYQPKVDLRTGKWSGLEALIRWNHPEAGAISPAEFVPRSETNGLINPIGRWVLTRTAQQARDWADMGTPFRISVNVSVKQIQDGLLLDSLLVAQRLAGGLLDLELTETVLADDEKRLSHFLWRCREMGYGIHLDDFGTGYSSFSRLVQMPLTAMKIDRSFIARLENGDQGLGVIRSMIAVAHELSLEVVAEGVETAFQVKRLREIGVHKAQGWFYSKALEPAEVLQFAAGNCDTPSSPS